MKRAIGIVCIRAKLPSLRVTYWHNCHSLYFNRNRDNENSSLPEKHEKNREKCNTTIALYYVCARDSVVIWILESFIRTCSRICYSTVESHQLHTRNSHCGSVATRSTRGREGGQQLPAMPLPLPWEIITVMVMSHEFKVQIKVFAPSLPPIPAFHSYEPLKSPLSDQDQTTLTISHNHLCRKSMGKALKNEQLVSWSHVHTLAQTLAPN